MQLGLGAERSRDAFDDVAQTLLDQILALPATGCGRCPPDAASSAMMLNAVPASILQIDTTARVHRVDVARDDALHRDDDVRCDEDRIDRQMRPRGVAALAGDA